MSQQQAVSPHQSKELVRTIKSMSTKKKDKARVMIISDCPTATTGYASAAFYTGKYLRRMGIDIAYVALQNVGGPQLVALEKGATSIETGLVPSYSGNTTAEVDRAFEDWKPDVGIHCRDAFAHTPQFFQQAYSFLSMPHHPPIIGWIPVQADMLPQELIDAVNREYVFTVTFTEWGNDVLLFQGVPSNKQDFVWLGYDEEVFYPLSVEDRMNAKKWLGLSTDKPSICSVGVNDQHRKGWPLLMQALGIVKKKVDIDIYFHTVPDGQFLLRHFAKKFGLAGQIAYPENYDKSWGKPVDYMNKIYNAAGDLYCSASIEEGFSVPLAESMATGSRMVVTDMPVYREVCGDFALYPKTYKIYPTAWSLTWLVDPQDMAVKILQGIEEMADEDAEKKRVEAQLKFAARYTWKSAAEKWVKILRDNKDLIGGIEV